MLWDFFCSRLKFIYLYINDMSELITNGSNDQVNLKDVIKLEYIKCAQDCVHFMRKYCYITHPIRGRILFHLFPFQEKILKLFQNHKYSIVNKSRQIGLSTLVAAYALWLMIFHKDKTVLCIATKQVTAANMVEKVQFMYNNLPIWVKGNKKPLNESKLALKLSNNSQIVASSASPDTGRSYAVSLLIIDEAAHIEDIDRIYTSIKPTISAGGSCIALSSPNGVGNWFHQTWVKAELAENDFIPIKLPWQVHPERDQAWYDKESSNMSPRSIAQEYNCDFLASGNTIIDPDTLKFYDATYIIDPLEKAGLGHDFWIWQYPDYSRSYLLCADVARGDGTDFSTFHVIDIENCEQVAEFKAQLGTREFAHELMSRATYYNNALVVVENANMGWDVIMTLVEKRYPSLYYSPKGGDFDPDNYISKINSDNVVPGFSNNTRTRPLVIGKLEAYIREKTFIFHSKRFIEELRTFIWENGKAQGANGYNDDLCLAAGIGMYIRDTALKFEQFGMAQLRASLDNIQRPVQVYQPGPIIGYDPYKLPTGNGQIEDISWLLD